MIEFMEDFEAKYRNASDWQLTEAFIQAGVPELSSGSEVYIVIDGIDECPDRSKLCDHVLEIAGGRVRVLVSSRSERDISEAFQHQHHILFTEEQSHRDIATHIEWSFEHDKRLKKVKSDLKKEIKEKLLSKSDGM